MKKAKQVQINESLFFSMCQLINKLDSKELPSEYEIYLLKTKLEQKQDAMKRRDTFTKYKTATPGSDQREDGRMQYLEERGIASAFTTKNELSQKDEDAEFQEYLDHKNHSS